MCDKMSEQTTERIKLHLYTKRQLEGLKTEENWTFDSVIQFLLCEHDEINDPHIIAGKEKKLRDEYVEIAEYNRVYKENTDRHYKIKELEDEFENQLEKFKGDSEQFTAKFKEQHKDYAELQSVLNAKEEEMKTAKAKNDNLTWELDQVLRELRADLLDAQKKYEDCKSDYNDLSGYLNSGYLLTEERLKTLQNVIYFLSSNRRHTFTAQQIVDKYSRLPIMTVDNIEEVSSLFKYVVIPVNKYLIEGKERFGFDRHYLKY
jgi:septation ring formation regulator EzrA